LNLALRCRSQICQSPELDVGTLSFEEFRFIAIVSLELTLAHKGAGSVNLLAAMASASFLAVASVVTVALILTNHYA
jgi:hypothetical protein